MKENENHKDTNQLLNSNITDKTYKIVSKSLTDINNIKDIKSIYENERISNKDIYIKKEFLKQNNKIESNFNKLEEEIDLNYLDADSSKINYLIKTDRISQPYFEQEESSKNFNFQLVKKNFIHNPSLIKKKKLQIFR